MSKKKQMHTILGEATQGEIDAYEAGVRAKRQEWKDELFPKLEEMFEVANSGDATGKTGYGYLLWALAEQLLLRFWPDYDSLPEGEKATAQHAMTAMLRQSDLWQLWCLLCQTIQDGETHKLQKFHRAAGLGRLKL